MVKTRMQNNSGLAARLALIGLCVTLALLLVRGGLSWARGVEVARSTRLGYTVVVHKELQQRYKSDPVAYLADSGEDRSTLDFTFTVYGPQGAPATSFRCTNPAFEGWGQAKVRVRWLSVPQQRQPARFAVNFDGYDALDCQLGQNPVWKRH